MKIKLLAQIALLTCCTAAFAGDEDQCMDCHEPAEDWEGLSVEEIVAAARDPENKRHRDNDAISDELLRELIAKLIAE